MKQNKAVPKEIISNVIEKITKAITPDQTTANILSAVRQLEPEDQNEVIKAVLSELAVDRHTKVREFNEASARAAKSMDTFMCYAMGIEKLLASEMEKRK